MKRWLLLSAALAAVGFLSRLPHPARDISELEPVEVVWLHMEESRLVIETDTGAKGTGKTLSEASENMKTAASAEIFLDTAEYLIIDPDIPIPDDCFTLFRPDCKVCFTTASPDMEKAADYLSAHTPPISLSQLRANITQSSALRTQH